MLLLLCVTVDAFVLQRQSISKHTTAKWNSFSRSQLSMSGTEEDLSFFERLANPFGTPPSSKDAESFDGNLQQQRSSTTLPPGFTAVQNVVEPLQTALDDASSGWALSYADLRPETSASWAGQIFLATNFLYFLAGIILTIQGDYWFGFMTEITSIASFMYHYTQLEAEGETKSPAVRLALLFDYILAITSLSTATFYLLALGMDASVDVLISVALSFAFLGLSWVYEQVLPYLLFHGLWHVFGAYAGLLIGTAHNQATLPDIFS